MSSIDGIIYAFIILFEPDNSRWHGYIERAKTNRNVIIANVFPNQIVPKGVKKKPTDIILHGG